LLTSEDFNPYNNCKILTAYINEGILYSITSILIVVEVQFKPISDFKIECKEGVISVLDELLLEQKIKMYELRTLYSNR
jgi:hypothetical protein